jgi:general secretion pathway protein K
MSRRTAPLQRSPRGAALLVAMLVLSLIGTLAAGMVWQQWRAVRVEETERLRAQAAWILTGALDLGRVILRIDARSGGADHLGEPWATQLQEASLAGLLSQDRSNNVDVGPEVYLSGGIRDAQSRYNLRNLVDAQARIVPEELAVLQRLCETAGVGAETAQVIASGLAGAWSFGAAASAPAAEAALAPRRVEQLAWLGLDAASVRALLPFVELLPEATPLNLNTAAPEVLVAVLAGLDASSAQRIAQTRQNSPFKTLDAARSLVRADIKLDAKRVSVASNYFEVSGRLRAQGRMIEERMLVTRRGREVFALWRERRSLAPE